MIHFAFFDVDETIILENSMFAILTRVSEQAPSIKPAVVSERLQKMCSFGHDRAVINREFYREFKGLPRDEVRDISAKYIYDSLAKKGRFIVETVVSQLEHYRGKGYQPVFVSGSAVDFIEPLAAHLRVRHCLATWLEVDSDGRYTGEIKGEPMIGVGKRTAVQDFLALYGGKPEDCAGFGDHISDLPFLEIVGQPHVVGPYDHALIAIASQRGWPVLSP